MPEKITDQKSGNSSTLTFMARLRQQLLTWQGLYIPLQKSRKIASCKSDRETLRAH